MFLPCLTRRPKTLLTLFIVSAVFLILSIVLIVKIFPDIISSEVDKQVRLEEGTEQYDRFLELPFPVDFKVYIFNVTNPDQIKTGAKPKLEEIGPYLYKQYRKKTVHGTNDHEDTVSYTQTEYFVFDVKGSNGLSNQDVLTVLNAPMLSVLQIAESIGQANLIGGCLGEIFSGLEKLFVQVKVQDLLFDGISFCDPSKFRLFCAVQDTIACNIAKSRKNVDSDEERLKFSYFNYKARSHDGLYRVKRGLDDISDLGSIVDLNNATHTNFWGGPDSTCDEVKGTDSTLYPPRVAKDSIFQIYSTDICRYVEINYLNEDDYSDISGYLFATNQSTLRARNQNRQSDCFCGNQTKGLDGEDSCFLDGVIDMQPCIGVPVLLSFPHFLWADQKYLQGVDGLSPDENLHRTFLNVEPNTGTPLQGVKRIQINAVLRPIGTINVLKNVPRVVVPLVWIEEGVSLSQKYIDMLNDMYFSKVKIVDGVQYSLLAVFSLLTLNFGIFFLYSVLA